LFEFSGWSEVMIKGIKVFLVFMVIAVTSTAQERNVDLANGSKELTSQAGNNIVPPIVKEKYEYYEICGCNEKDVQCELKQKCIIWPDGKKYDSVTSWKVKWDYGHNRTPQACSTNSFIVTVEVVFHLPKLVRTGNSPKPLLEKWDTYIDNLIKHEYGHRDRVVEAATEITRAVKELPPARTCAELDREVQALSQERMQKLDEEQEEYDAASKHGQKQGAIFP
jgi:predicted secreted Zn-dependent protease